MPDGRDRVGYAFNIAYIESKGIVSEMQEGIGITNVYNAIWVRRRKSGSFFVPLRRRQHYIGALTISFVILTANCARKVVLRKHVVVRIVLTFLTHTFFSRGGLPAVR